MRASSIFVVLVSLVKRDASSEKGLPSYVNVNGCSPPGLIVDMASPGASTIGRSPSRKTRPSSNVTQGSTQTAGRRRCRPHH